MRITILIFAILYCKIVSANIVDEADSAILKGDFSVAFSKFTQAAAENNSYAQYNLGAMYEAGKGVVKNLEQANYWYKLSAQNGNHNAQFNFANNLYNGKGIAKNNAEAFKYFKLSASQGNLKSQFWLGVMYKMGHGVLQNFTKAHMWLNLAGLSGNTFAIAMREDVEDRMTALTIAEAQLLAQNCKSSNFKNC